MIQTPHLDALMSGPWPQWARERKEEAIMSMWAKEGTPAGDLFNLINDYFDAGYLEGKEGRSMDTPDRKADRISSAIHEHLQRYAALVERVEELEGQLHNSKHESDHFNNWWKTCHKERDRYREALERVEEYNIDWTMDVDPNIEAVKDIARQALRGEGE